MRAAAALLLLLALDAPFTGAQSPKPRARELGIAPLIGGTPGPLDAITDVSSARGPSAPA